jgi:hypothetical protein
MYYMIRRSHRMQKYKLGVTCPSALFVQSVPVPPENEEGYDHTSRPGPTRMHNETCRFHRMQKHKCSVTCPGALYMKTAPDPHEHEK